MFDQGSDDGDVCRRDQADTGVQMQAGNEILLGQPDLLDRVPALKIQDLVKARYHIAGLDSSDNVRAKVDTGARTSALDVLSYELHEDAAQGLTATLKVALDRKHPSVVRELIVPVVRMVVVSNSSGMREQRPLVETTLRLGPVTKRVRLTITNRAGMRFRMILGRKALEGDFVVDVAGKYLLRRVK